MRSSFALANPDPEITYPETHLRHGKISSSPPEDPIIEPGNNVLRIPHLPRRTGCQAAPINEAMKLAAGQCAIAELAKDPVPEIVNRFANQKNIVFGKGLHHSETAGPPFHRPLHQLSLAQPSKAGVAQARSRTGTTMSRTCRNDWGLDNKLIRVVTSKARQNPQRVVFAGSRQLQDPQSRSDRTR